MAPSNKPPSPQELLAVDREQVIRERRVEGDLEPGEWLALLGSLVRFARERAGLRRKLKVLAIISAVAGTVLTFIVFLESEQFWWMVAPIALGFLAVRLVDRILEPWEMVGNVRRFVAPMIGVLREDIEPGKPLHLRLDLRRGTEAGEQTGRREWKEGRRTVVETLYSYPWLAGAAPLADGSRLEFQVVSEIRQRRMSWRNPRGKSKSKTKYRVKSDLEVRLALSQKDYARAVSVPPIALHDRVSVKPGEKRNTMRVRREVASSDPNAAVNLKDFLDLVARAYAQVAPTRSAEG